MKKIAMFAFFSIFIISYGHTQDKDIDSVILLNRLEEIENFIDNELHTRLDSNNSEINNILIRLDANEDKVNENKINDNNIRNRLTDNFESMTWLNRTILTIITIIFAITFALVIKHDYEVTNKAKKQLIECDNLVSNIKEEYKKWINKIEKEYKNDLQLYNHLYSLKFILLQEKPLPEEIFPHLTELCSHPKSDFKPIFSKIITLDVGEEITKKAKEGLSKITNV